MRKYIILPEHGTRGPALTANALQHVGGEIKVAARPGHAESAPIRVLSSLHEDGPKLVEMEPETELELRVSIPGVRVVPVIYYSRPIPIRDALETRRDYSAAESRGATVMLTVKDQTTQDPLEGASIAAFTNFRHREGADGVTNRRGQVRLSLPSGAKIDRLYIFPPNGYWGYLEKSLSIVKKDFFLTPIRLTDPNSILKKYYREVPFNSGDGVTVGVIDTGVAEDHPDLHVAGGANLVTDELLEDPGSSGDWRPSEINGGHGTHVAGVIAARGASPHGLRGVAPRATIRSYRVFPDSGERAMSFDIIAAIDRAVLDGCHIINLSLGGPDPDEAMRAAVAEAIGKGVLVVAAVGNGGRKPVNFPAAFDGCVAVSAFGDKGCFPAHSVETGEVLRPFAEGGVFFAAFSNEGPQTKLTAPGVGVVSTVPGGYAVMSGTSMAAPVVSGFAAALLSESPELMSLPPALRGRALARALYFAARPLGFGRDQEGYGMLDPTLMRQAIEATLDENREPMIS